MTRLAYRPAELDALLAKLDPRDELVVRYALRSTFRELQADPRNTARIDALYALLAPSEDELAAILAEARERGKALAAESVWLTPG